MFTAYALFGKSSLCWFSNQSILEISKSVAWLGLEIMIPTPVWNLIILLYMWLGLL